MNSLVNKQFNNVAADYDFVTELLNNNDFFVSNMSTQRNTVLDVGCGSGILALELSKYYKDVIGIDISEQMLSIANSKRKKENIRYINMDANELDFDKKFDLIVSRTTFHHLSDIPTILNKMRSLLNKNGKIVILDNVSEVETPATYGYILGAIQEFIPNCFKYNIHSSVRVFKHST